MRFDHVVRLKPYHHNFMCDGDLIIYIGSLKILTFDVKNRKLCTLVMLFTQGYSMA